MKKIITLLSAAFAFAVLSPVEAKAGHDQAEQDYRRQTSTCGHCNHPVYKYKRFAGYDCHGHAVYQWVTARHSRCDQAAYRARQHDSHAGHGHDSHAGHGHSSRSDYRGRGRSSGRPPLPHEIIGRIFGRR